MLRRLVGGDAPYVGGSATHCRVVLDERVSIAPATPAINTASLDAGPTSRLVDGGAVTVDLVLDAELRAVGDWRGPYAVKRDSDEFEIASRVIQALSQMTSAIMAEVDPLHDGEWGRSGIALKALFGGVDEPTCAHQIRLLARACQRVCTAQPLLVHVPVPAKVFGDVHGQLRDLLLLFGNFGFPSHRKGDVESTAYVFNGDWIDRGAHQLEVRVCRANRF